MDDNSENTGEKSFCHCVPGLDFNCFCGEDHQVNWTWETTNGSHQIILSNGDKDVQFHPGYSSGTAAIRGNSLLLPGHHYFWEVKMLTSLYGTDVMVGVGTEKVEPQLHAYRFCSILGQDDQSWGYSYRGGVQHDGQFLTYGPSFGRGSIIGVHLDMCAGTMEFYFNRKPLGVAFTGLGKNNLYPMVSSTAAKSAMRVISAVSYRPNLQLDCLLTIYKDPLLRKEFKSVPGLVNILSDFWWTVPYYNEMHRKKFYRFMFDAKDRLRERLERKRKAEPDWLQRSRFLELNLIMQPFGQ